VWFRVRILILFLFRVPQRYGNNTRFDEIQSREEILDLRQVAEGQWWDRYLVKVVKRRQATEESITIAGVCDSHITARAASKSRDHGWVLR